MPSGSKMTNRRGFFKRCVAGSVVASFGFSLPDALAQTNAITPIVPSPQIDQFEKAQQTLLRKYNLPARSRYLKLTKPPLTAHVLEVGDGAPVLLLHGGN